MSVKYTTPWSHSSYYNLTDYRLQSCGPPAMRSMLGWFFFYFYKIRDQKVFRITPPSQWNYNQLCNYFWCWNLSKPISLDNILFCPSSCPDNNFYIYMIIITEIYPWKIKHKNVLFVTTKTTENRFFYRKHQTPNCMVLHPLYLQSNFNRLHFYIRVVMFWSINNGRKKNYLLFDL